MRENSAAIFQNKYILVLGLAKSGMAVAKLLSRLGAKVTVNERQPREACTGLEELESLGIQVICGSHPLSLLDQEWSMIVKNPGIPFDIPFLVEAEKRQIAVVTEIEIAYLISEAPIIAITGSNGKTTTTTLIYEMLKKSNLKPAIAGNIGTVFCEVAEQVTSDQWIVAELSSFQLLSTRTFKPEIAVLLNIFDAHLDYHHTKEHYIGAKKKLFANQTEAQLAILPYDQELTQEIASEIEAQVSWFSMQKSVDRGAFLEKDRIKFRKKNGEVLDLFPVHDVQLIGEHNIENILAAVSVALEVGATIGAIQEVLATFEGVPHRLQFIRELEGIRFYNDSKATNALATCKALLSFQSPVILIAGGLDRGEDFSELHPILTSRVSALISYGQISAKISKVAEEAGVKRIIHVDNVKNAVTAAYQLAEKGDTVLLSPAAASWDQFRSFEERGDMFTQSVHMLR